MKKISLKEFENSNKKIKSISREEMVKIDGSMRWRCYPTAYQSNANLIEYGWPHSGSGLAGYLHGCHGIG